MGAARADDQIAGPGKVHLAAILPDDQRVNQGHDFCRGGVDHRDRLDIGRVAGCGIVDDCRVAQERIGDAPCIQQCPRLCHLVSGQRIDCHPMPRERTFRETVGILSGTIVEQRLVLRYPPAFAVGLIQIIETDTGGKFDIAVAGHQVI